MAVKAKPNIEVYCGATGSGKGVSLEQRLKELAPGRLVIWDPRNEYKDWARPISSIRELAKALLTRGPVKVRLVPPDDWDDLREPFQQVCRIVFAAGNLVFLAEELPDVTMPSWCPPQWKRLLTQGRHKGLHILVAAQRPALADKVTFGMCTRLRVFSLRYAADRKAMAEALDVPAEQIAALQTVETSKGVEINFFERDFTAGTCGPGQIKLSS